MSIIKGLVSGAVFCLLLAGCISLSESNRVTARLFAHYLGGSGEAVTLHLPRVLDTHCPVGTTGVVSTYGTSYEHALGRFTCTPEGSGYDVYDFTYSGSKGICNKLHPSYYLRRVEQRRIGAALQETPANLGRCVVGLGVGKPYTIQIK